MCFWIYLFLTLTLTLTLVLTLISILTLIQSFSLPLHQPQKNQYVPFIILIASDAII